MQATQKFNEVVDRRYGFISDVAHARNALAVAVRDKDLMSQRQFEKIIIASGKIIEQEHLWQEAQARARMDTL